MFYKDIYKNSFSVIKKEPTSALDPESVLLVENYLKSRTCIWITHDPRQQERVATHTLTLAKSHDFTSTDSIRSNNGESSRSHNSNTTIRMK